MYVIKKDLLNLLSYPVYFNCQKSILDILKIVCETFEVKFFTVLLSLWDSKICVWETFCFYTFIFLYFLIFIFLYYFIFIFLYFTGGLYGGIVRQWNVSLGNLLFHCFTQPANLTRHSIAHLYFPILHFIFLFWTFYILLYCYCICIYFILYSLKNYSQISILDCNKMSFLSEYPRIPQLDLPHHHHHHCHCRHLFHGHLHHHHHDHPWWRSVGSRRLWGINFSGGKKIGGDWWWRLSS